MADSVSAPVARGATTAKTPKLIGSVSVQPSTVRPGQSVRVEVLDGDGRVYAANSPVVVTINGIAAARRFMQFVRPGTCTLQVRAFSGTSTDEATATVTVAGDPLTFRRTLTTLASAPIAKLQLKQTFTNHYLATFMLGVGAPSTTTPKTTTTTIATAVPKTTTTVTTNAARTPPDVPESDLQKTLSALPAAQRTTSSPVSHTTAKGGVLTSSSTVAKLPRDVTLAPQKTSYKWDFGDGTTATTQAPSVSHDYFPAIQAEKIPHAFDVACTVVQDNITVTRTLVLNSAYGICKQLGTIVPNVESDVFAQWRKQVGFSASMTVYNIESAPITLTAMGFVPLSDDPNAQVAAPTFTKMKTSIAIKPKAATAVGILIPIAQLADTKLGSAVPGFIVYYRGSYTEGGKQTPVLFSRTFRIPLAQSGGAWLTQANAAPKVAVDWTAAAKAVVATANDTKLTIATDAVVTDEGTQTLAVALPQAPHDVSAKAQVRTTMQSGLIAASGGKAA